eukprot:3006872-Pyramimonas_sp.AAC.1
MNGQGEDESNGQSEEESSQSMETNEESAPFHTSPGPSYRRNPVRDASEGLASGVDLSDTETNDYAPAEGLQKATLDSDDDLEGERSSGSGIVGHGRGSSSAQPIEISPDAM